EQFTLMERLHQVVVGARLESGDDVFAPVAAREQNQISVRAGRLLAQPPADLGSVEARHHPVEDGERRRLRLAETLECLGAVPRDGDGKVAEGARERLRGKRIVVCDEHLHHDRPRWSAWSSATSCAISIVTVLKSGSKAEDSPRAA